VAVGELSVFGYFIVNRLVSCSPCCGRRVSEVGVGIGIWYCDIPCQRFAFCPGQQRDTIRTLAVVTAQTSRFFFFFFFFLLLLLSATNITFTRPTKQNFIREGIFWF